MNRISYDDSLDINDTFVCTIDTLWSIFNITSEEIFNYAYKINKHDFQYFLSMQIIIFNLFKNMGFWFQLKTEESKPILFLCLIVSLIDMIDYIICKIIEF